MEELEIVISDADYALLNRQFPPKDNSADIGRRAIEFIKIHLKAIDSHNEIRAGKGGTDLELIKKGSRESIEVKGTASPGISWSKLKVSSKASYDSLMQGTKLYRVMGVNSRRPKVCILTEGDDFEMIPELQVGNQKSKGLTAGFQYPFCTSSYARTRCDF